jgi:nucleoside phosphorylase
MKGLIMATRMEAQPFIEGLTKEPVEEKPFPLYRGGGYVLIISGIGKVNAAVATAMLAVKYDIRQIFNLGAAGALASGRNVGDILHISGVYEHDRPSLLGKSLNEIPCDILEGHDRAKLATGDVPVTDPGGRSRLSRLADLVDMEGAAVARTCRMLGAEYFLFKIVTDTPEHTADRQIIENVRVTRGLLFEYFMREIDPAFRN